MSFAPIPAPDCFHVSAAAGWLELDNVAEARAEMEFLDGVYREHPDALDVAWKIFAAEQDWRSAQRCGEKLVALVPDRASAWISYSYALHELKQTQAAFDELRKVSDRFKDHYVIPYNLACYQCQLGDKTEALRWLQRAVDQADAPTIQAMALNDPDLAALREEILRLA